MTVWSLCEVVVWVVLLVTRCNELFCEEVVVFFDRQYFSFSVEVVQLAHLVATCYVTEDRGLSSLKFVPVSVREVGGVNRGTVVHEGASYGFVSQGEGFFVASPRRASKRSENVVALLYA